jgi:hypothetical protein
MARESGNLVIPGTPSIKVSILCFCRKYSVSQKVCYKRRQKEEERNHGRNSTIRAGIRETAE